MVGSFMARNHNQILLLHDQENKKVPVINEIIVPLKQSSQIEPKSKHFYSGSMVHEKDHVPI
jgi:hypothetical protein